MRACVRSSQRLRRLVFSDRFYILYGGVGWGGMGSGDQGRVEETRWVNKPHPRLADPEDRKGDQVRRGQVRTHADEPKRKRKGKRTRQLSCPVSHGTDGRVVKAGWGVCWVRFGSVGFRSTVDGWLGETSGFESRDGTGGSMDRTSQVDNSDDPSRRVPLPQATIRIR